MEPSRDNKDYIMAHVGFMKNAEMRSRLGIAANDEAGWQKIVERKDALWELHRQAIGLKKQKMKSLPDM